MATSFKKITVMEMVNDTMHNGWNGLQSNEHEFFAREGDMFVKVIGILVKGGEKHLQVEGGGFIPASGGILSVWTYNDPPAVIDSADSVRDANDG